MTLVSGKKKKAKADRLLTESIAQERLLDPKLSKKEKRERLYQLGLEPKVTQEIIYSIRKAIETPKIKVIVRKDEDIYLVDTAKGTLRTDTGRTIKIDPKIWNAYKKKDKIVKIEISTGLGITKSGKKVSLIVKPKKVYKPKPYVEPELKVSIEAKTKLEEQRKKAEAVKEPPKMVKAKYEKDGKMVTEFVVAGDPKLKKLAAIKRVTIKPLSEAEIQRIQITRVRQMQDIQAAAQLYQDQLKAQKFLSSAYRGRIKPFPRHGFPISRIQTAYRKRKPTWRLRIRHNKRENMIYIKMVGPANKLSGRDEVEREVKKILSLMRMSMTPSAVIEDVRSPIVRGNWAYVNLKVNARKVGPGEIRPRG